MAEIAVLGYGTVGSGVVEALKANQQNIDRKASQPIRVKYVFDVREFPDTPIEKLLTHNIDDIIYDNDVRVVVEAMGGVEPAYTYVKEMLARGKNVCTSNKELVAKHGAELLTLARDMNINFLFEASVGGGIPIIRPLNSSLAADEITEISGILNGTTNYILTKMTKENGDFHECLETARQMGYAERDPSADIDGLDSCRKLAILVSLAIGKQVDFENIGTEGISKLTPRDIAYANELGGTIKLLATAKIEGPGVYARVSPVILRGGHPLAFVNDVYNAIYIRGKIIGEVMFYGRGAGKFPTASAVIADVVDAVKNLNRNILHFWSTEKHEILPYGALKTDRLVRVATRDAEKTKKLFNKIYAARIIDLFDDEIAAIVEDATNDEYSRVVNDLAEADFFNRIVNTIAIEGE